MAGIDRIRAQHHACDRHRLFVGTDRGPRLRGTNQRCNFGNGTFIGPAGAEKTLKGRIEFMQQVITALAATGTTLGSIYAGVKGVIQVGALLAGLS